ncbi:hypothetical protein BGZ49_010483 [Haplosporangium sp. Z 27]|nr:hypothetical protein BGZ49_010483 [Haplosporangium sp. Z 27]
MGAHTVLFWLASQGAKAASSTEDKTTPTRIYLSNLVGSLSILCWFIVFTPQLWTNYKRKSGESLSLTFLYIWLAGDIMNLIGATMDNLLITMQVLAWYYTVADIALIIQIFYYRKTSVKASFESVLTHASPEVLSPHDHHRHHGEHAPLIAGPSSGNYSSINQSEHVHENDHDRVIHEAAKVANATASQYGEDHLQPGFPGELANLRRPSSHSVMTIGSVNYRARMAKRRKMIRRALMIFSPLVLVTIFAWAYYDWLQCTIGSDDGPNCGRGHGGHGKLPPSPSPAEPNDDSIVSMMGKGHKKHPDNEKSIIRLWLPLILGWGSAVLYLGSRIPQIYKNWRLKSCEGLSILMFVFSVFGNVFYVASIFLNSIEIDYLIRNMPWWLGSGGTLLFDFTIFFQFYIYRFNTPLSEALKEAAATGELDENALMATAGDDSNEEDNTDTDSTTGNLIQHTKNKSDSTGGKNGQSHVATASDVTIV